MNKVYIGLGSNLEDPITQLTQAFNDLSDIPNTRVRATSSLYASHPIGPAQPDYVNAVAELETSLAPLALLDALQAIEQAHHRVRKEHWGPRTLDLDILLIDDQILNEPRLTVPHPFMLERNFVLIPLHEIAPNLLLPNGQTLAAAMTACGNDGIARLAHKEN